MRWAVLCSVEGLVAIEHCMADVCFAAGDVACLVVVHGACLQPGESNPAEHQWDQERGQKMHGVWLVQHGDCGLQLAAVVRHRPLCEVSQLAMILWEIAPSDLVIACQATT